MDHEHRLRRDRPSATFLCALGILALAADSPVAQAGFSHAPRGAAAVFHLEENLQLIVLVGPEAFDLLEWNAIEHDRASKVMARCVPDCGADLNRIATLTDVTALHLTAVGITDAEFARLVASCPSLERCSIRASETVSPDELSDFSEVELSQLHDRQISGAGLLYLGPLPHLHFLALDGLRSSSEQLVSATAGDKLETVFVYRLLIDGDACDALAGSATIQQLTIKDMKVTVRGLSMLQECTALRHLKLSGCDTDHPLLSAFDDENRWRLLSLCLVDCGLTQENLDSVKASQPFTRVHEERTAYDPPVGDTDTAQSIRNLRTGFFGLTTLELEGLEFHGNADELLLLDVPHSGWLGDLILSHAALIPTLQAVKCRNGTVSAETLVELAEGTELKSLDLRGCDLPAGAGGSLASFEGLEELDVSETQITDQDVSAMAPLGRIRLLNVGMTDVTNAALGSIEEFENLSVLSIAGCNVSDAGAESILKLRQLTRLVISRTHITADMEDRIRAAIPEVTIQK